MDKKQAKTDLRQFQAFQKALSDKRGDDLKEALAEASNDDVLQLISYAFKNAWLDAIPTLLDLTQPIPSSHYYNCVVSAVQSKKPLELTKSLLKKLAPFNLPLFSLTFIEETPRLTPIKKIFQKLLIPYATPRAGLISALLVGKEMEQTIFKLIPEITPDAQTFSFCLEYGTRPQIELYLKHGLSNEILYSGLGYILEKAEFEYFDLIWSHLKMDEPISPNSQKNLEYAYRVVGLSNRWDILEKLDAFMTEEQRVNLCMSLIKHGRQNSFKFIFERCKDNPNWVTRNPLKISSAGGHEEILKILLESQPEGYPKNHLRWAMMEACNHGHLNILQMLWEASTPSPSTWDATELLELINPSRLAICSSTFHVNHQSVVNWVKSHLDQKMLQEVLPNVDLIQEDVKSKPKLRL